MDRSDRSMMNLFHPPIPLPEHPAPPCALDCRRCELAKQRTRVIWGEGRPGAPLYVLLDNPGAREDREGQPFVCGTRETLQEGLHAAGIPLEDVYVTYLLKCRPVRAYDKPAAREACSVHLQAQFDEGRPRLLLGLGNVVAQAVCRSDEAEVKQLRGEVHDIDGIRTVFSYHPLAVRRRPNLRLLFEEDLRLAARTLISEKFD
jgi:uracil-DNA glycosylase